MKNCLLLYGSIQKRRLSGALPSSALAISIVCDETTTSQMGACHSLWPKCGVRLSRLQSILSPDPVYNFLLQVQASNFQEVWPAPIVDFASYKVPLSEPGLSSVSFRRDRFLGALDVTGCMILSGSIQEERKIYGNCIWRSPCRNVSYRLRV